MMMVTGLAAVYEEQCKFLMLLPLPMMCCDNGCAIVYCNCHWAHDYKN